MSAANHKTDTVYCDEHTAKCAMQAVLQSDCNRHNDQLREHEKRLQTVEMMYEKLTLKLAVLTTMMSGGATALVQYLMR